MSGVATIERIQAELELLALEEEELLLVEQERENDVRQEQSARETIEAEEAEKTRCSESLGYFIRQYVKIYDNTSKKWIDFDLWAEQEKVADLILENPQTIVLKARQLGLTWLVLAVALWLMIFHPISVVLIFSLREIEAKYLLSTDRIKGMFSRLPLWLRPKVVVNGDKEWKLDNGSVARAFATTAGDSYAATFVIVDEADLVPNLNSLLQRAKPTIDAGGRICLISRSDKDHPNSEFKQIYRAAAQKLNAWVEAFLPWFVRPSRTEEWYQREKADVFANTGCYDNIYESYPATAAEALAPKELNKRIPSHWLAKCYQPETPLNLDDFSGVPTLPNLRIFRLPVHGKRYFLGCDPAQGNPNSHDSAISIVDEFGEEVCQLRGKFEVGTTADYVEVLCKFYNNASAMILRNNHGHAILLALRSTQVAVLYGYDKQRGWVENTKGKSLLWDNCAEAFKDGQTIIHDLETFSQLASIEGSTLKAPDEMPDDVADSYAAALIGLSRGAAQEPTAFTVF